MRPDALTLCGDSGALSRAVALAVDRCLRAALDLRGHATLAVPGGTTPRLYLAAMAALPLAWERITVTLTDERWVAPDSAASNAGLVRAMLLAGHAAQARFIALKSAAASAAEALVTIDQRLDAMAWPLDLALLGVGDDGHIASLFPGQPDGANGRVVATTAPVEPRPRISLTLAALASARELIVVATGADKYALILRALRGEAGDLPLARLCAAAGARVRAIVMA